MAVIRSFSVFDLNNLMKGRFLKNGRIEKKLRNLLKRDNFRTVESMDENDEGSLKVQESAISLKND